MKSLSVSHVTKVIIYMCIYFIYRDYIVCEDQAISATSEKVWIECLGLFETDREIVLSPTGWLNDRIINAAQTLLKNQFPELSGFQDVGLGQVMNITIPVWRIYTNCTFTTEPLGDYFHPDARFKH